MSVVRFTLVGVLISLLVGQSVSAGLFGFGQRRWERRKAEIRNELLGDLSNKMDQDLAREVESVRADLTKTAITQVKSEGDKLQAQVDQAVAELRKHAQQIVAAETAKLDAQVKRQVVQLRAEARQAVTTEAAKLAEQNKAIQVTLEQQISGLPARVTAEVEKAVQQRLQKPTTSPAPAQKQEGEVTGTTEKGTLPKKTEVKQEPQ